MNWAGSSCPGKPDRFSVYELNGLKTEVAHEYESLCDFFSSALDAFRDRNWKAAVKGFQRAMQASQGDGPSKFYLNLCQEYAANPPGEPWDGVVRIAKK